eukprot:m.65022 g.65022  ORF g.65022 m.65022 type:complete len:395 (-) comp13521_c1_seq1:270-1454(-)
MAFLHHDMSPREPNLSYEPSQGQPLRDHKLKGFSVLDPTNGGCLILDAPVREVSMSSPPKQPARHQRPPDQLDPGFSSLGSKEFYSGKHSSPYTREPTGGIKAMFDNAQRLQEQSTKQREFERQYTRANAQQLKHRRAMYEAEKQSEIERSKSHLTTDPWERERPRVAPNARIPRANPVTKGDHFQQNADSSYAAQVFGKGGAGAPRRDVNGQLVARRTNTVATYKQHQDGPSNSYAAQYFGRREPTNPRIKASVSSESMHNESKQTTYNDQVFGKVGVAGRPRQTNSGQTLARHRSVLASDRHHLDVPGEAYNDAVFKQQSPAKVVNGEVRAKRVGIEKQLQQVHATGRLELFDHVEDMKHSVKINKPPAMSRDEEFRGKMLQQATLSTSIHK